MVSWHGDAWEDYLFWQQNDKKLLKRINELIEDIQRQPYTGIGKPEALKHDYSGFWSRRIDEEHRLVCKVDNKDIIILQCHYRYRKN
jgi:toxin YoeB